MTYPQGEKYVDMMENSKDNSDDIKAADSNVVNHFAWPKEFAFGGFGRGSPMFASGNRNKSSGGKD